MTDVFGLSHKDASPTTSQAHEQVVFCADERSGLRAIIAIYSTALGPGLGGTRFYPTQANRPRWPTCSISPAAMAYKNALAGLDLGGGKAVIIGDPAKDKTEALLRAYGRFVQSLGGRYLTACDVGTYVEDMDVIARECDVRHRPHPGQRRRRRLLDPHCLRRVPGHAGRRRALWGTPTLRGRRVGVEGVGKVGHRLVDHLLEDGAEVVVSRRQRPAVRARPAAPPAVDAAADTAA